MVRQCRRDSERLLLQFSIAISGFTEKSSGRGLGLAGLAARETLDASVTSDVPGAHRLKHPAVNQPCSPSQARP
jgi:hypothetical protein